MALNATSRVFHAQRQVKVRLEAQTFPAVTGLGTPQITLALPDPTGHAEIIYIVPDVGDDVGGIELGDEGTPMCNRLETVQLTIEFSTATGETDDLAVLDRLEEVCDVIQRAFYDDTTNTYSPLPDAINTDGVIGINSQIFPRSINEQTDGTLMGVATITYRTQFRI